jgi:hypothetical protein
MFGSHPEEKMKRAGDTRKFYRAGNRSEMVVPPPGRLDA